MLAYKMLIKSGIHSQVHLPMRLRSFRKRLHRLLVRRPRGHLGLIARMKWHDLHCSIRSRNLVRRAGARTALLMILPKDCAVAEIGVWRGAFSALIRDVVTPKRLLLIDPWAGAVGDVPWRRGEFTEEEAQQHFDDAFDEVRAAFSGDARIRIIRAMSLDAADQIADQSLDVVYIDGSHDYEDVRDDLRAWSPKLRQDGLLTGDDYYWSDDRGRNFPVRRAVDEFIAETRPKHWAVYRGQFVIHHH